MGALSRVEHLPSPPFLRCTTYVPHCLCTIYHPIQIRALALKEKGNQAFGAKRFEEAVEHFSAAIQLDGT